MKTKSIVGLAVGAALAGALVLNTAPVVYSGTYTAGLVVSQDYAVVDGADISNTGSGVCLKVTGDHVTVRNSKIHDCKDHGILLLGVNGALVENNEVYRAAMRNPPNTISGGWPSMIKVQSVDETPSGLAQDIILRGNYVHNGYGEGFGLRGSNILIEGNTVVDAYSVGIYGNSDHATIRGNFVLCTGDPEYNRGGLPMSGIGFAEETFAKWGAHGHDSQTVVNNIVSGCKYGFRYGNSANGMGLVNTVVAFNTFHAIKAASVSITYYANQTGVVVENNIISSVISAKNIVNAGNVRFDFQIDRVVSAEQFRLSGPLLAVGLFAVESDFRGGERISPLDVGAWDYGGEILPVTLTPVSASATVIPSASAVPTVTRTPVPAASPTWTPTPECIYFESHKETICVQ